MGGWEISGITTISSATPFSILNSENALGMMSGAVSTVEGSQRGSVNLGGTRPTPSSKAIPASQWHFVNNSTNSGIIGTVGRNTERTGGTINFNMALSKNIRTFGESHRLKFRWELHDLFKHRNFTTIPNNTVSSDIDPFRFLNLGQTNVGGRTMLFSLVYMS